MIPQGLPSGSPFLSPLIRQRIVYRCAGLYLTVTVKVAINVSGRADIKTPLVAPKDAARGSGKSKFILIYS